MDTAPNALSPDVNSFVPTHRLAPPHRRPAYPLYHPRRATHLQSQLASLLVSPRLLSHTRTNQSFPLLARSAMDTEASPSRSDSFSRGGWPRCKARCAPSSLERLDVNGVGLGESFNSSTASFIDMDPEELFSMRWTTDDDGALDLGPSPCAGSCSTLLATAGLFFSDDGGFLPTCEPTGIASASAGSSPAFHTARSTPASVIGSSRRPAGGGGAKQPLLATRRLLLRYLRFLVPLCRKARALRVPARAFSVPRSRSVAATPARRSTSSATSAAEYWCHGNADTAVRDAILHCKKSLLTARTEC